MKNIKDQFESYQPSELTILRQKRQVASAMRMPMALGCLRYFFPRKAVTTPIMKEQMKFKTLMVLEAQCFFICCSKISLAFSEDLVSSRLGVFYRFCIGLVTLNIVFNYKGNRYRGYKKLLIKQFIENNFISSHMTERPHKRSPATKTYQYDDWICLMCQNLNYSFRKTCNRPLIQAIDAGFRQSRTTITLWRFTRPQPTWR